MSDRFPGEIYIGGKIPESRIFGLIQAINQQQCSSDWGDRVIKIQVTEGDVESCKRELLRLVILKDDYLSQSQGEGWLHLCDDQARYGEFEEIENYCENHHISYSRISSCSFGYDAERKEYRPGMSEPQIITSNQNGDAVVPVTSIKMLLDLDCIETIKASIMEIVRYEDIPALEPVEIVEESILSHRERMQ